jgi:hypothetical protein
VRNVSAHSELGQGSEINKQGENTMNLPIACSLTADELAAMRNGLLPGLLAGASGKEAIPGGFRWRFGPREDLVKEAGAVIDAEHGCCRFLRFVLVVEPGDGPVWLEVTGPEGTKEFLSALLDTTSAPSGGR